MTSPFQDKFLRAYDKMAEHLTEAIKHTEEKTIPSFEEHLKQAQNKAHELGELTLEESEKIACYLKRDLQDVSAYLHQTQAEFSDWLAFESTLLEGKADEWFNIVADRTKLQWNAFNLQTKETILYHSGEVTGSGTLSCTACKQTLNFKKTGHIPPCPKCHKTRFARFSK
ncbi:MAG: hypothetical protein A6F71_01725 [Cycloclasticus sp. symbiont of Poecilosclerida sp. M]|nr:MAG: hypothetical protein A6F71_01725 [Cycloclasticus sp. symbiont of Poecilosclerida sp. M]